MPRTPAVVEITQETGDAFRHTLRQVDKVGFFTLNYREAIATISGIQHLRRNIPQRMTYAKSIILDVESRDDLEGLLNRSTGPAPNLEHLALEYANADAVVCTPERFLADSASCLAQLKLVNCIIPWTSSLFRNLTSLEVAFPLFGGPHPVPTLPVLINVLHQHESLQTLHLSNVLPAFQEADQQWMRAGGKIALRHLDNLELKGKAGDVVDLYTCLDIPSTLKRLHLSVSYASAADCDAHVPGVLELVSKSAYTRLSAGAITVDSASLSMWDDEEAVMSLGEGADAAQTHGTRVTVYHDDMAAQPPLRMFSLFLTNVSWALPRILRLALADHPTRHVLNIDVLARLLRPFPRLRALSLCLCTLPAFSAFFMQTAAHTRGCPLPCLKELTLLDYACEGMYCDIPRENYSERLRVMADFWRSLGQDVRFEARHARVVNMSGRRLPRFT
ncbi:hypothetical protein DENSPDRAFT_874011 [Dentipellis sp. KUC8613]|nr:hypothetical protein DENSPDRAFT_874011 [Dentipellis sp. KUC8613]